MGLLGGLFILGATSRRATASGALVGAFAGAIVMFFLWRFTTVNGYLYTISGMLTCVGVGILASMVTGPQEKDIRGLTIYTLAELKSRP
jgi:Na+/proline symporter